MAANARHRSPGREVPNLAIFVLVSMVAAVVVAAFVVGPGAERRGHSVSDQLEQRQPRATESTAPIEPRPESWREVLGRLDAVRERAWMDGSPRLLRLVYVDGSKLLSEDRSMLRAYLRRGLRVDGVELLLHRVRVVERGRGCVRLATVDELAAATADADGVHLALPDDQPTRHLVVLRREHGRWQVAAAQTR